ncbi:MAG: ABC transporter permease [Bacteroidales bacterium]|nr:ABC transporter permease [Bacteroidales bacterium]MCI2144978.1 ABC transporter permease [Bacteroidales bacterium]
MDHNTRRKRSGLGIFGSLVKESALFSLSQLKADKFRTFLSLLGITIGIFSIVAVFSVVSAMKISVSKGLDVFGKDVMYVMQYPLLPEDNGEYKWWEYRNRPEIKEDEYKFLKKNVTTPCIMTDLMSFDGNFKRGRYSLASGGALAVSENWEQVSSVDIMRGRYLTDSEIGNGSPVAVIGSKVSSSLFPDTDNPVGKSFKVNGRDVTVVGVLKKSGESMVTIIQYDKSIIVPMNFGKNIVSPDETGLTVVAMAKNASSKDNLKEEIKQLMRRKRHLKPVQKNNFSVDELSMVLKEVSKAMSVVNIVGWIIGGFSLLIGGFGIANIMFVSVKERTTQIGIQKALGAQKSFIMGEFLFEAVLLSLVGGIVGILLVYLVSLIVPKGMLDIILTFHNVLGGLLISIIIGILSGFFPARAAADMDPVAAINS